MEVVFEHEAIRREYERWTKSFGAADPYRTSETVGIHDVLRAHFLIADYFYGQDYGLGGIGPKDANLLHSAVYRQFVSYGGRDKWSTPYERCATLVFGIVKDHAFHDANKRTGLLVWLFFLYKMKRVPTVGQRELEDFVVELADDQLAKYPRYRDLAKKEDEPGILFFADYIKRTSRQLDSRYYCITYHQLDGILKRYGFALVNPNKNYIDVARMERSRKLLGLGREYVRFTKLGQVGFPGWKSQVGKGAISTVRNVTKLVPEKGVDSEAFFHGTDALDSLIDQYSEPLRRLAYR